MNDSPKAEEENSKLAPNLEAGLASSLFDYLLHNEDVPPERRIFVNRTLRMESIHYVGFDLDWTLADYERIPLEQLTFELATERLIAHHGYPEEIRKAAFRPNFPRRGLLIDKEAGTVLRMNRHRFVNLAYHGRRRLDRGDLKRLYRYEPIRPSSDRFYHLDSLFELPEANLYSELIEMSNLTNDLSLPSTWQIFDDLRAAIDWVHAEGALKSQVLADPARYLKRDPEVGLALLRLALGGRRLFLLTNSDWSYASFVCSFLFDGLLPGLNSWRELFDLVLVESGKPRFFRQERQFLELNPDGQQIEAVDVPTWGGIYSQGSLTGLMQLINEPGEHVLYIGDHIYGDIVSSKLESTWRTTLIVRELENEIQQRATIEDELLKGRELRRQLAQLGHEMDHLRDVLLLYRHLLEQGAELPSEPLQALQERTKLVTKRHRQVLREEAEWADQTAQHFDTYWGSFFKQGTSKTRFAAQLETYACLYTSRVSNFSFYGSNRYFRVASDPMMHELASYSKSKNSPNLDPTDSSRAIDDERSNG